MPYIKQDDRDKINPHLELFIDNVIKDKNISAGDLNYMLSKIVWTVFNESQNYSTANSLMGVLQGVQSEFYRRKVAPYEDLKIKQNGDIE